MRLLTRPAWLHDDKRRSWKLVRTKISAGAELTVQLGGGADVAGRFVVGVSAGLADEQDGQAETEPGVGEAEEERFGP